MSEFTRLFMGAVNKIAPMRSVRVRQKQSPWINSHILAGIRQRDSLLSRFKQNKDDIVLYKEYCRIRNRVQRDVKMAKSAYFRVKIDQSKGDSGKLWGLLKSLGYSKSSSTTSKIVLENDGVKVFDSLKPKGRGLF